jgi:outer membrane protein OmpA-like peptidoglycan-associated protein
MAFFGAGETNEREGLNARRRVEMFSELAGDPEPEEPLLRPSPAMNVGENNLTVSVQHSVYFYAESGTRILDRYLPLLRETGRRLQADPRTRVTLRGYAAPIGTKGGQITRSAARVWYCAEYLMREYGIREERIRTAFFGAEGMSESENAELNLRRRVEIIVEEPVEFHYAVFFEAESGTRINDQYLPLLREAGRRLSEYPHLNLFLQGYAGTDEGQTTVSAARAWYCTE